MSFFYYMHGLYIKSDICLYDIKSLQAADFAYPDVTITMETKIKTELDEKKNQISYFSNERAWFKTEKGYYLIENGNAIMYAPLEGAGNNDHSSYILGWSMCFLMCQRGKMGIHCSALSFNNKAFLVSGLSGAGKSTTSRLLIKKGFKYCADDIAFVSEADEYMIYPSLPLQKICQNNMDKTIDRKEAVYIDEDRDKYAIVDTEHFDTVPRKLSVMFLLEVSELSAIEYAELTGIEKISAILNSLFMTQIFEEVGFPMKVRSSCLKIAGNIRVIRIKRPKGIDTANEICDFIGRYLEQNTDIG